tara:strand:+ start:11355 stop:11921 length:567 start_codon:yes stop_codon:yes gene_type:complete
MIRIILQSGITIFLITMYSISLTPNQEFEWREHTEVTGMQFLLKEYIPGCKSTPHLQSEDASLRLRNLDATVETLRSSYENKDLTVLNTLFTPLKESARILNAIQHDVQFYDSMSLTFSIDRILITQHNYSVHLHWEGVWHTPEQNLPLHGRGLSVFKFTGNQQITLHTIDGDSPFGMGERNIPEDKT